jgi:hypothetical protein
LIPELDEALTKFDSGVDGTDSGCGTGSRMFNIAEYDDCSYNIETMFFFETLTLIQSHASLVYTGASNYDGSMAYYHHFVFKFIYYIDYNNLT